MCLRREQSTLLERVSNPFDIFIVNTICSIQFNKILKMQGIKTIKNIEDSKSYACETLYLS